MWENIAFWLVPYCAERRGYQTSCGTGCGYARLLAERGDSGTLHIWQHPLKPGYNIIMLWPRWYLSRTTTSLICMGSVPDSAFKKYHQFNVIPLEVSIWYPTCQLCLYNCSWSVWKYDPVTLQRWFVASILTPFQYAEALCLFWIVTAASMAIY